MEFAREREDLAWAVVGQVASGALPERVTHNDTKISNVLFDETSGEGICVIDLDTVMPGTVVSDFGDLVRTTASSHPEDSRALGEIHCRVDVVEALAEGYLEAAGPFLTQAEIEALPMSGRLLTFESGLRFLTDYLAGDTYFKTSHPEHNLDRARVQFALVRSIERSLPQVEDIVGRLASRPR